VEKVQRQRVRLHGHGVNFRVEFPLRFPARLIATLLKYLVTTLRPPGISLAVEINIFLKPKAHGSEPQPVSLSAPNSYLVYRAWLKGGMLCP
jgi:hypothetical protein